MIDGLSCENCPDKKRCKEQQEKKNNIIKNILNDIVDKAKIYGCDIKEKTEILFQQIPDVTRCDVVLEKQLKRKEQECEKYKNCLYEIKNFQKRNCETCNFYKTENCNNSCQVFVILKIINEVENER